ncbi:hypothetical protein RHCRD62_10885 [Rhodococcus sp. RD6.2]|nr:hypothetical protein RHCRD62_10885 [Rhodococcus sp. RD6.2]
MSARAIHEIHVTAGGRPPVGTDSDGTWVSLIPITVLAMGSSRDRPPASAPATGGDAPRPGMEAGSCDVETGSRHCLDLSPTTRAKHVERHSPPRGAANNPDQRRHFPTPQATRATETLPRSGFD